MRKLKMLHSLKPWTQPEWDEQHNEGVAVVALGQVQPKDHVRSCLG